MWSEEKTANLFGHAWIGRGQQGHTGRVGIHKPTPKDSAFRSGIHTMHSIHDHDLAVKAGNLS